MPNTIPPQAAGPEQMGPSETVLSPFGRINLGDDEFAICGRVDLGTNTGDPNKPNARLVLLDVGFHATDRGFGPYDIAGTGEKRYFQKPYVIAREVRTPEGPKVLTYEFGSGEEIMVGRRGEVGRALGLKGEMHISRSQVKIKAEPNGSLIAIDQDSVNGSGVRSAVDILGNISTKFDYTVGINDYVSRAGQGALLVPKEKASGWGYGEFAGRPIIARDTPINTGIYPVGGWDGEALIVDDTENPKELDKVYNQALGSLRTVLPGHTFFEGLKGRYFNRTSSETDQNNALTRSILSNVFEVVYKTLRYDSKATNAIAHGYQEVAINEYIRQRVGVCRTQGLLSAYLVERLIKEGKVPGRVSIDRNSDHVVTGGHAWARFTDPSGEVFIIDPAQRYVGSLKEVVGRKGAWDYRRSEDLVKTLLHSNA